MAKATGFGGVFYKAQDPKALMDWYQKHLGIERAADFDGATFRWRDPADPDIAGYSVLGLFKTDSEYLSPSEKPFMVNFLVDDLEAMLAKLRAGGVEVDEKTKDCEFGRFGWFIDPEGVRIELCEPPKEE